MKHFIEIKLLPNSEVPLYFLWQKVYQQLHLALVEVKDDDNQVCVGVSFPDYTQKSLGQRFRLFADDAQVLEKVNIVSWLSRLLDYLLITEIKSVPETIDGYAFFRRVQVKSSDERIARRRAKFTGMSYQTALEQLKNGDRNNTDSDLPFIKIKSHSSNNYYYLFIGRRVAINNSAQKFSTYGLSASSAVPLF